MKKMILLALLASLGIGAKAQVWSAGELGYTYKNPDKGDAQNSFSIGGDMGVFISDRWAVALASEFNYTDKGNSTIMGTKLTPYLRYHMVNVGDLCFFVDNGMSYGFASEKENGVKTKTHIFEVGVRPGLSYAIADNWGLVSHLGFAGYQYQKTGDAKSNSFGFNFDNNISFGVYFYM